MTKAISGTKEWAKKSVNCVKGCSNNCRYCCARWMANRFERSTDEDWPTETVCGGGVTKGWRKVKGTPRGGMDIMFPTTHDLTPNTLDACLRTLDHILAPGNSVLVTSKPHPDCIRAVCERFSEHNRSGSNLIMFRFTIGAMDDSILSYWDRNAPSFDDRFASLEYAFRADFRTSISIEPMLDSDRVVTMFRRLKRFVTDTIWIGKMNDVRRRVAIVTVEDMRMVQQIEAGQANDRVREIYAALKHEPHVRWKESFKKVLGLPLATEAGGDRCRPAELSRQPRRNPFVPAGTRRVRWGQDTQI